MKYRSFCSPSRNRVPAALDCMAGWAWTGPSRFLQPLKYRSHLPIMLSWCLSWKTCCVNERILVRRTGRGETLLRCGRRRLTPGATHMCWSSEAQPVAGHTRGNHQCQGAPVTRACPLSLRRNLVPIAVPSMGRPMKSHQSAAPAQSITMPTSVFAMALIAPHDMRL
jgi:hypothetical protein